MLLLLQVFQRYSDTTPPRTPPRVQDADGAAHGRAPLPLPQTKGDGQRADGDRRRCIRRQMSRGQMGTATTSTGQVSRADKHRYRRQRVTGRGRKLELVARYCHRRLVEEVS
ncbi:hypothetical protein OsI_37831 [Oryza sativa Indica Group]|uniref:Uncharacterized protein n=1 Tax=Oryza sativa subsp. indica TaxID=39946 RepID=B8BNN6_ORYSI|nr:hypothetical protein OsI_37831 [Oryza sativa Indica Group]